jgi:hypothetical protein
LQTQRTQSTYNDHAQAIANQGSQRYLQSEKHFLSIGPGPYVSQIAEDGITDRTAQRILPRSLRFAMRNTQFFPLPIEVLETQGRYFSSTEAVYHQQHQQSAIADVNPPVPFRSRKQTPHVIPGRADRQTFVLEDAWSHDRSGQSLAAPATSFCEAKKTPQSRGPPLNRDSCKPLIANLFGQQFVHLGHGQLLESEIRLIDLREKLVRVSAMANVYLAMCCNLDRAIPNSA